MTKPSLANFDYRKHCLGKGDIDSETGTPTVDEHWSRMTDERRVKAVQAALDAYRAKAKADPGGARDRLIATGIWLKNGQLAPEYGGPKGRKRKAA